MIVCKIQKYKIFIICNIFAYIYLYFIHVIYNAFVHIIHASIYYDT